MGAELKSHRNLLLLLAESKWHTIFPQGFF
jgi:hypothetical protein